MIPVLVCDPDTKEAIKVELQCALCSLKLSASNESRIAGSHLRTAGCKVVQSDPEVAAKVAAAFLKTAAAAEDVSADKENDTDSQLLQRLASKKRKASDQPSVAESFVSEAKQKQLTEKFYDFFLENSDCVAMHACEHPAMQALCRLIGINGLKRKVKSLNRCQQPQNLASLTFCFADTCWQSSEHQI